ncbi:hypothetical protein BH11MYX4_BH11MYX4_18730 [soil metagenome]
MATFLTTSRMDPALAQRIEASVSGRTRKPGGPVLSPRLVALVRIGLVLGIAFVGYAAVAARRRDRQEIDHTRASLLAAVQAQAASLTAEERGAVVRADSWLVRFSGSYEGDLVAPELQAPGALKATLARPAISVRGPLGSFVNPARIADAAATSSKDALLLCLMDPPASKVEKVLLGTVRTAYSGGAALEERTGNVRRLQDAIVGLPLLMPAWAERVRTADDPAELAWLRRELEKVPRDRAKQAARANLLVVALDEPSDGGGPTELDGERAHAIRIGVVDLAASKVLLRMRRLVDPTWISLAKKSEYASGLDSCGLAFEVHEAARTSAK